MAILTGWILISLCGCACGGQQKFAGKTVVVTGASSGFGKGVAIRRGEQGANVVIAARRPAALQDVVPRVEAAGGRVLSVPTDVSREREIGRLAAAAVRRFGRIDVWINNAGVGAIGRFEDIPPRDHERLVDVNLKGVILGGPAALRQFRRPGESVLVNVGSVDSEVPHAYQAARMRNQR